MNCKATHSAISLQESESGVTRLGVLAGQTRPKSGLEVVPASRFQSQENAEELKTNDTFGQFGASSLESAVLQLSLENRLQEKMLLTGSTMYKMTWRHRATQLGQRIFARQASVPRISGRDSILLLKGWGTPVANPANGKPENFQKRKQKAVARGVKMGTTITDIQMQAKLVDLTNPVRLTASGETLTGSNARMGTLGQLCPNHSRWLMALPPEWDEFAPTETLSVLKSRRDLSARI